LVNDYKFRIMVQKRVIGHIFLVLQIFVLQLFVTHAVFAQELDPIITNHILAVGDKSKWDALKSITLEGKINDENLVISYTKSVIPGKCLRYNYSFESRSDFYKDKKYFILLSPTGAWRSTPEEKGDTVKLKEDEILVSKDEMNLIDPFVNAISKGIKIIRLGDEFYLDKNHYKFQIDYNNKSYYYYLDVDNFHIIKRVLVNADYDEIIEYENYEKTALGISMPKKSTQHGTQNVIEKIKINDGLKIEQFKL